MGICLAVDGSYKGSLDAAGIGFVVYDDETEEVFKEFTGYITIPEYVKSRQVGGELLAAVMGFNWCLANGYKDIKILYDFVGVRNYVNLNKLTKPVTQEYQKMMLALCSNIPGGRLSFEKVKGHSGNKWNDIADSLAGKYTNNVDVPVNKIREILLKEFDVMMSKKKTKAI